MISVLKLDDVCLYRGDTQILSHVSWKVDEGEHWVVLGPNGVGKTTILRIAAARLFPSSGTVDILGERLGRVDLGELRPRIGMASSALAAQVSGGSKVVDLVLSASYGTIDVWRQEFEPLDTDRAEALLGALGISHLADRRWSQLSSGERKRVEIARALMPDPELLVLDEPASGLDVAGREELLAAITEILGGKGAPTIVLVTHHLEEIPTGFTHALALREGKAVAAGPVGEVVTSAVMSETFGVPLEVRLDRGRFSARLA
ncbi:Cobalt import ATP-binding protein CbiO [Actinomyces bovis]|uniref:Cobalt import ATP-binding protein CbiO n=1 Tax=Actinomyces bovis TaxID=1658 RepID=A0ABY1VK36_9ACTO|nr:ABC transporter ATP-binding protein [Actinomyces bovis]SPT52470.1 Cobalt import ATP-binding protein CbiO [Actinomyces bovis]VEG54153.1 Cobalt import ATP-binding protein CbiO [Actinomyces israelii]